MKTSFKRLGLVVKQHVSVMDKTYVIAQILKLFNIVRGYNRGHRAVFRPLYKYSFKGFAHNRVKPVKRLVKQ